MDMGLIAAGRGDNAVNVCELVIAKLHFEANGNPSLLQRGLNGLGV